MHNTIYITKNSANEYSKWAVSFFEGCLGNDLSCNYCCIIKMRKRFNQYIDHARLHPELLNEEKAFDQFKIEVNKNLGKLQKHGLFFSINTDSCLPKTIELNQKAILYCDSRNIPTTILTKQTWWVGKHFFPQRTKIGVTLTGMDEFEPGCPTNLQRIELLKSLSDCGYTTWSSLEPVIELHTSYEMIELSKNYCNHYKIGLLSGKKFDKSAIKEFISSVHALLRDTNITIYWKDSIIQQANIKRETLPSNSVQKHYDF